MCSLAHLWQHNVCIRTYLVFACRFDWLVWCWETVAVFVGDMVCWLRLMSVKMKEDWVLCCLLAHKSGDMIILRCFLVADQQLLAVLPPCSTSSTPA